MLPDDNSHLPPIWRLRAAVEELEEGGLGPSTSEDEVAALLRECRRLRAAEEGRRLHRLLRRRHPRLAASRYLSNLFAHLFAACADVASATSAFHALAHRRNLVTWNALLSALASTHAHVPSTLFAAMPRRDAVSWSLLLQAHAARGHVPGATAVFDRMPAHDIVAATSLVAALTQRPAAARSVFESVPAGERDVVLWNTMLHAYTTAGQMMEARQLLQAPSWRDKNAASWTILIAAYASRGHLAEARQTWQASGASDLVTWNALLAGYAQAGRMAEATELLSRMPAVDTVGLTAIAAGYARRGQVAEAEAVVAAMAEHADAASRNTLLTAYAAAGDVGKAAAAFQAEAEKTTGGWNSMVAAWARAGDAAAARRCFDAMAAARDEISWATLVSAYGYSGDLDMAAAAFRRMPGYSAASWNALLTCSAAAGGAAAAKRVFDGMPTEAREDAAAWNALVAAHARQPAAVSGSTSLTPSQSAVQLLLLMDLEGVPVADATLAAVIRSCASASGSGGLRLGRRLHVGSGVLGMYSATTEAVLGLYGAAGCVAEAEAVFFGEMERRSVVTWNTMLSVYARHHSCSSSSALPSAAANGAAAVERFFWLMLNEGEALPDGVSMLLLLSAFAQAGQLHHGCCCYASMLPDFGLRAGAQHYACVVDMLVRAGHTQDAQQLLLLSQQQQQHSSQQQLYTSQQQQHPSQQLFQQLLQPEEQQVMLTSLASSSAVLGELDAGGAAAAAMLCHDRNHPLPYVLLCNFHCFNNHS